MECLAFAIRVPMRFRDLLCCCESTHGLQVFLKDGKSLCLLPVILHK